MFGTDFPAKIPPTNLTSSESSGGRASRQPFTITVGVPRTAKLRQGLTSLNAHGSCDSGDASGEAGTVFDASLDGK